jgi:hypothetical protein
MPWRGVSANAIKMGMNCSVTTRLEPLRAISIGHNHEISRWLFSNKRRTVSACEINRASPQAFGGVFVPVDGPTKWRAFPDMTGTAAPI